MSEKVEREGERAEVRGRRVKTPEQALSSLMALCSKSEKSSGDAIRLMYRWGVEPSKHAGVLERLIEQKFIDDNRYAEAYTRDRIAFSGWGAYKIRRSLSTKGISSQIIDRVLSELLNPQEQRKRLEKLLKKKRAAQRKEQDVYRLKGQLMRYGMGAGYDYDDVVVVVESLFEGSQSEEYPDREDW